MFDSTFLRKLAESEQKNCNLQLEIQKLELQLERDKMCPCLYDGLCEGRGPITKGNHPKGIVNPIQNDKKIRELRKRVYELESQLNRELQIKSPFCHTHNINTWIPNRAEMNEVVRIVEELHSDIRRIEEVIENHLCGKKGR